MVNFKNKLNERPLLSHSWQQCYRLTMVIAMMILCAAASFAATFTGYVKDENGEPVIGASVVQKGNPKNGTVTDIDGKFSLNVGGTTTTTLTVTSVGYQEQSFKVTSDKPAYVTLVPTATNLKDVVVVAYGTQKKVSVTAAVSSVSTRDIKKSSAARLDNALQGRISGLVSYQNGGGMPGVDGATMFLRGASSNSSQSPLILVDGVERDNIGQIDPNEVESVSVLKDASATAVFGVRGANGVILITTRRGHDGRPDLSVSFEQSWTSFTKKDSRIHSVEWMKLRNEAVTNDGGTAPYSDEVISHFTDRYWGLDETADDYAQQKIFRDYMYPDHDWVTELFRTYTPQSKVNINMAGGSKAFKYFLNAGYIHQGSNVKNEDKSTRGFDTAIKSDQWKFRSNLDFDINKYFKATLNLSTYIRQNNMPQTGAMYGGSLSWMISDLFYQSRYLPPIFPGPLTIAGKGTTEAGYVVDPTQYSMDRSPYQIANRRGYEHTVNVKMQSTFGLEYDLSHLVTQGLRVKGNVSYDTWGNHGRGSSLDETHYNVNADLERGVFNFAINGDIHSSYSLWSYSNSNYKINAQAQMLYNRTFGKHDIGGMILAQRDYEEPDDSYLIPHNVVGLSLRATYAYDSRYLLDLDFGYNGSEQFAPGHRFGSFPAMSIGWVISNEKFMAGTKDWLDNFKIRYSLGRVGSDTAPRFLYMDNIQIGGSQWVSGLGSGNIRSVSQGLLGNDKISWETADKANYGFDLGLFKQFTLTFNYYNEHRRNILIHRNSIPVFQGIPTGNIPMVNLGRIHNHGVEIELGYNKQFGKDLRIEVNANWGTNRNKVVFMDEVKKSSDYAYQYTTEGWPLGQCWGYKIDYSNGNGYFNTQEEIDGWAKYASGKPRLGDFKYVDVNQDGVIDNKDVSPIKHTTIPGITYGASFNITYRNVDFAIFFSGLGRFSQYYGGTNVFENIASGAYAEYQRHPWSAERYANGEKITYPALTSTSSVSLRANDFFIMNRAFTRLKNVIIGYTLPQIWMQKLGIKSCRIYASGENLAIWEHLPMHHIDPEQSQANGYPITKNMTVGINVNF
jgi:TonB-linked SusC/RagA family outer membrane protein